jgi:Tc5 transposase DNA-binding domain.
MPASKFLVQTKTHSVYEDLSNIDDNVKPLSASTGWFSRFMKRYNFITSK